MWAGITNFGGGNAKLEVKMHKFGGEGKFCTAQHYEHQNYKRGGKCDILWTNVSLFKLKVPNVWANTCFKIPVYIIKLKKIIFLSRNTKADYPEVLHFHCYEACLPKKMTHSQANTLLCCSFCLSINFTDFYYFFTKLWIAL